VATLVAIAYPGEPDRATSVAEDLESLPFTSSADLDDAVAVYIDEEGTAHLQQSTDLTNEGAIDGALIGLVAGVVLTLPFPFLAPIGFAGAALATSAIGAITGGVIGHYSDIGIDDEFVREVSAKLPKNSSALFVLVEGDDTARVLAELASCGGELVSTDLPAEQAAKLSEALKQKS
jgi:uncharacterized membrane protein